MMTLPSLPGLERRLAYGELVRRRNRSNRNVLNVHVDESNIPWAYRVLTEMKCIDSGLTLGQLFYNSKVTLADIKVFCAVCQEYTQALDIVRELKCTHTFHVQCIDRWLTEHTKCPLCKSDIVA